ncbi:unnamed protein product [Gongylonema pulchrum]|uniref:RRP15-like protein n=1 Tax=Gongylonema pulchrum TaxID=637853 RepID=A0A183E4Z4_9BILA|nr:unnamed protein product [Gongylonema pulchrum]
MTEETLPKVDYLNKGMKPTTDDLNSAPMPSQKQGQKRVRKSVTWKEEKEEAGESKNANEHVLKKREKKTATAAQINALDSQSRQRMTDSLQTFLQGTTDKLQAGERKPPRKLAFVSGR